MANPRNLGLRDFRFESEYPDHRELVQWKNISFTRRRQRIVTVISYQFNSGSGTHGSQTNRTIEELLSEYKELISFEDSMEKNNFKWVMQYLKREKKKNPHYETECREFMEDVVHVHKRYLENKSFRN